MVRMHITFIIASNIFITISKQELSTSKQLKMNSWKPQGDPKKNFAWSLMCVNRSQFSTNEHLIAW